MTMLSATAATTTSKRRRRGTVGVVGGGAAATIATSSVAFLLFFSSSVLYMHSAIVSMNDEDLVVDSTTTSFSIGSNKLWSLSSMAMSALLGKEDYRDDVNGGGGRRRKKKVKSEMTLRERFESESPFYRRRSGGDGDDGDGKTSSSSSSSFHVDMDGIRRVVYERYRTALPPPPLSRYNVSDCPDEPPENYPHAWNALDVLYHWNVDDTSVPRDYLHQGLCAFDWNEPSHHARMIRYRNAEVPFVLSNHPELLQAGYRWNSKIGVLGGRRRDDGREDGGPTDEKEQEREQRYYLEELIGWDQPQRNEHSKNNHFMFWRGDPRKKNKRKNSPIDSTDDNGNMPPTDDVELTYRQWHERSAMLDGVTDDEQIRSDHYYFRLNSVYGYREDGGGGGDDAFSPDEKERERVKLLRRDQGGLNEYMYDELPIFIPDRNVANRKMSYVHRQLPPYVDVRGSSGNNTAADNNDDGAGSRDLIRSSSELFMVEQRKERGLNCRCGSRGAVAESHFDPTRNWIVVLGGKRRYVLAHPNQCANMELYPKNHPSARHSKVNWSKYRTRSDDRADAGDRRRPFHDAMVNEVVLQSGDALYLPTSWFHFIVSLSTNYQCNARSGVTHENDSYLYRCGFPVPSTA